jgi:hypothetical protein
LPGDEKDPAVTVPVALTLKPIEAFPPTKAFPAVVIVDVVILLVKSLWNELTPTGGYACPLIVFSPVIAGIAAVVPTLRVLLCLPVIVTLLTVFATLSSDWELMLL